MTDGGIAVAVRGLERRFGTLRVLRGLDLNVATGDTVAIFGSNGAGKTTFLRILAGLLSPDRGEVSLFGTALPGPASLRRRIGVVAHDSYLYGDLTAAENLDYYGRLYRVADADRSLNLLERVSLADAADRPVRTFSRGMQQRLALARAMLHEPDLVLFDEPFSGLDPSGAALLFETLDELKRSGCTILLTTHDFARGLGCADRAVMLHAGRVAWQSCDGVPTPAEMAEVFSAVVENRATRAQKR